MNTISPVSEVDKPMPSCAIPECLSELINFLENLEERAPKDELYQLLSGLDVCQNDLLDFVRFEQCTYRRNLISEGQWYELLCICWQSGQRSPIHNHAGSTCGLRIVQGCATETIFDPTPCGQIKAVKSNDFEQGFVCTSQDADIHQVSNLQASGNDLVTLHIYSPPLRTMDTFSLLGADSVPYSPPPSPVAE